MNVHDKLFHTMIHICEEYMSAIGYHQPSWMDRERYDEIIDLINTDWDAETKQCSSKCGCKSQER